MSEAALEALERLDQAPLPRDQLPAARTEAAQYLHALVCSPLETWAQQPALQRAAAAALQHQLTDVCLKHTPTFVKIQGACDDAKRLSEHTERSIANLVQHRAARLDDASRAFLAVRETATQERHTLQRASASLDTSLLPLLQFEAQVRTSVADGRYDEALQLAERASQVLPRGGDGQAGELAATLRSDLFHALTHMRAVLLDALRRPSLELDEAWTYTQHLTRLGALGHEQYPHTVLDMALGDVSIAWFDARLDELAWCLRAPMDEALAAWSAALYRWSAMALALFAGAADDTPAWLLAGWSTQATRALYAHLGAYLHKEHRRIARLPLREQPSHIARLADLYEQLDAMAHTLQDVGIAWDLPSLAAAAKTDTDIFTSTALELWRDALRAIVPRAQPADAPTAGSTDKRTDLYTMPPALAASPVCVALGRQLVDALNGVRHWADLPIGAPARDALDAALQAWRADVPHAEYDTLDRVLTPWARQAIDEGIWPRRS